MAAVNPPRLVLLMGVAGSGKSTVGRLLAQALGWRFNDADEFHPPENVAKMSRGIPLTDGDRTHWLAAIRRHIEDCLVRHEPAVVTCSALKASYRRQLVTDPARIKLVYLKGSRELLQARIGRRQGHFMKPNMLDSQLAVLEEPADALIVDITPEPAVIVEQIRRLLSL